MKYFSFLSVLLIFACNNPVDPIELDDPLEPPPVPEYESDTIDAINLSSADAASDMQAPRDSIADSRKRPFLPFDGVSRKSNSDPLNFNTYNWEDQFNYTFPQSPGFEKFEKDDHDSYAARTLVDGIIYEIAVEDYEKLGADKIDLGFTKYIHEKFISSFTDKIENTFEVARKDEVFGFASCYQYELQGRVYMADLITLAFEDKMVRFLITAKGQFENAVRVKEFVDGFILT